MKRLDTESGKGFIYKADISVLEQYYQKQFDAYNQRLAQHEESENKAERDYNMKSLKRCEERKQRLAALIEGSNVELIREEMLRVPDVMSLPFPYHVESHLDNKAISIILSFASLEDRWTNPNKSWQESLNPIPLPIPLS